MFRTFITGKIVRQMKFNIKLLISVIGMLILCHQSPVKAAELCPEGAIEEASEETRTYLNTQYGFTFELPANYRAALTFNNSVISILDPISYEIFQCLMRRKEPGHQLPPGIDIEIKQLKYDNLLDAIQEEYDEIKAIRTTTISGQKSILYLCKNPHSEPYLNLSFVHPNRKYLITISAPIEVELVSNAQGQDEVVHKDVMLKDIMKLITSTFKFTD